jgi:hypothetical protein
VSPWFRRSSAPGEGDDEQQANLDRAAEAAGEARKRRGQDWRRGENERAAREEPQPPDTPHP